MSKFGVAQPVRRVEDPRLLQRRRPLHRRHRRCPASCIGVVLRSPHAARHASRRSTPAAAKAVPGVLAVYTGADLKADGIGRLPCAVPLQNRDGTDARRPAAIPCWPTAWCATSATRSRSSSPRPHEAARDAAEADRASTTTSCPPSPTSPPRWTRARRWSGRSRRTTSPSTGRSATRRATEALFAKPPHVTRLTVVNNRIVVNSMEARAAHRRIRRRDGRWTLYANTQGGWLHQEPARRRRLRRRARQVPRHHARCRRRLRHEAVPLRRARADLLRRAQARPPGEMDQRAQRGVPLPTRRAATTSPLGELAVDAGRQVPRAAHPQHRQHGRLSVHFRALSSRPAPAPGYWPASTASRRSTPTSSACSPTPSRSTPIAAPAGRRATTWSSA